MLENLENISNEARKRLYAVIGQYPNDYQKTVSADGYLIANMFAVKSSIGRFNLFNINNEIARLDINNHNIASQINFLERQAYALSQMIPWENTDAIYHSVDNILPT